MEGKKTFLEYATAIKKLVEDNQRITRTFLLKMMIKKFKLDPVMAGIWIDKAVGYEMIRELEPEKVKHGRPPIRYIVRRYRRIN